MLWGPEKDPFWILFAWISPFCDMKGTTCCGFIEKRQLQARFPEIPEIGSQRKMREEHLYMTYSYVAHPHILTLFPPCLVIILDMLHISTFIRERET
ncbi:hypothetical protein DP190_21285 [Enterobacter cloacae]|nr:hypothetical protein DP190_21285 [Enterobacter cloacae]